jgi:hypothetical protein
VRAGDQSREGRAIAPRVAEERRNKDVLHAANVRPRRAGGRRGRRAGECVTPRESADVSSGWRAIACLEVGPRRPPGLIHPSAWSSTLDISISLDRALPAHPLKKRRSQGAYTPCYLFFDEAPSSALKKGLLSLSETSSRIPWVGDLSPFGSVSRSPAGARERRQFECV